MAEGTLEEFRIEIPDIDIEAIDDAAADTGGGGDDAETRWWSSRA